MLRGLEGSKEHLAGIARHGLMTPADVADNVPIAAGGRESAVLWVANFRLEDVAT